MEKEYTKDMLYADLLSISKEDITNLPGAKRNFFARLIGWKINPIYKKAPEKLIKKYIPLIEKYAASQQAPLEEILEIITTKIPKEIRKKVSLNEKPRPKGRGIN